MRWRAHPRDSMNPFPSAHPRESGDPVYGFRDGFGLRGNKRLGLPLSQRPVAAVGHDDRTGDVGRKIGSEKNRWSRDVLRLAGAAEWCVVEKDLHYLRIGGSHPFVQCRLDEAGADGIDAYAILAELRGERTSKAEHGVL